MGEAVHAAAGLDVDGAVLRDLAVEVVLADDLFRDVGELDADVLFSLEGRLKVEVGYVHGHELRAGGGDDAVEEHLGYKHLGGGGGDLAGIVDAIAAADESRPVLLLFFRAYAANKLAVGYVLPAVRRDVFTLDELDCVRGVLGAAANAVGQSAIARTR